MRPKSLPHTALLFLPVFLTVAGCDQANDATAALPRPVLTAVVASDDADALVLSGTIEPRYRTDLSFRVLGRVVSRDVEVGDLVRKGQRVAALDPTAIRLSVRSQRAALANARASLVNAAAVEQRQKTLRERNISAVATFEAAEQARIAAEAEVTRTSSELEKAEEQLTYVELRSDFDGVVTAISAEVGQVANVGQTIVTVARPDVREAVVDIPAAAANEVAPGTIFDVALQIDERVRTSGKLRELAPEADSITRSRRARITLDDPPEALRLGTTVTVKIKSRPSDSRLVRLPQAAVIERGGQAVVLVVDETRRTVAEFPVVVVSRKDDEVIVSGALHTGARIVTAGVKSLKVGQVVRLDSGVAR
jgi:RND family efflux transporter MFP subunit